MSSGVVPVDAFLNDARVAAPACPEPALMKAITDSCEDICSRSPAWVEDLAPMDLLEGVTGYVLSPPLINSAIRSVLCVTNENGRPLRYEVSARGGIELCNTPNQDVIDGLRVRATIKPTHRADEVGEALFTYHRDVVIHGTKHILFMQPGRPWTNPELGQFHFAQREAGIAGIKAAFDRQYNAGPARIRPRKMVL